MPKRYYLTSMEDIGVIRPIKGAETFYALDLGCGAGKDSAYLSYLGYTVVSVDTNTTYRHAIISDITKFDITKNKFNIIICNNVLPFLNSKDEIHKTILRMVNGLEKGGHLWFTTYGANHYLSKPGSPHKIATMSHEEIQDFVQELSMEVLENTHTNAYMLNGRKEKIFVEASRFLLKKI